MASDQKNKKSQKNEVNQEKLKKEVDELKKQVEENKSRYLRALADYQNLENRINNERIQINETAVKNVLLKLLPFLDNLEQAEAFINDSGLKLIKENFSKTLLELGLEEIQVINKPFDPYTAEAIDLVPGKEDDKVIEVLRKGYNFKGKILRVAQVRVSKKSETRNPKSETNSN